MRNNDDFSQSAMDLLAGGNDSASATLNVIRGRSSAGATAIEPDNVHLVGQAAEKAIDRFSALVESEMERTGVSRVKAAARVAQQHPTIHAAYVAATGHAR